MAQEHPLIRVPTQSVRVTLFEVIIFSGFLLGIFFGTSLGHRFFGHIGAIIGALAGGLLGFIIGFLPRYFSQEHMFRAMQRRSNEQLKAMLEQPRWNFYQVLALLNLLARNEDVQPYLPRVLTRLESDDYFQRVFARDALRLVFTPQAVELDKLGYDPVKPVDDCRNKIAQLSEQLLRQN